MSYLNDYIKPTDYGAVRKDINRILSLIHDITAQEPEDEGLQERICISSNVKLRTTTVTTGGTTRSGNNLKDVEIFAFRKKIPNSVKAYPLLHTTTGTLTFGTSATKFGGAVTFDGSSYISIADHVNLEPTSISFGGWFYLPATDSGDTASQTLIDKGVYSLTVDPHATAANQLRATINTLGLENLTTEASVNIQTEDSLNLESDIVIDNDVTYTFTPDAWNHIWVTWADPNLKLYIDKVLVSSNVSADGALQTNSNALTIG